MTRFIQIALTTLAIAGFAVFSAGTASAGDPQIDAAKAEGIVGERADGLLGVVESPVDASLLRKVQEVNAKRRALYDKLAAETGTTTEAVAQITGEKQVAGAAPGEYVMDASGTWTRK